MARDERFKVMWREVEIPFEDLGYCDLAKRVGGVRTNEDEVRFVGRLIYAPRGFSLLSIVAAPIKYELSRLVWTWSTDDEE